MQEMQQRCKRFDESFEGLVRGGTGFFRVENLLTVTDNFINYQLGLDF